MPIKALYDTKNEAVSYEDDPTKFCQQIYEESSKRAEDLAPINEENRLFYEGIDDRLRTRGANTRVVRSNLFIHEMTPGIDTRISDVISRIDEEKEPLFVKPNFDELTPAQKDQKTFIERQLNIDLRESGYLTDVFREHVTAAEIYRSPSAVKVGWGRGHRMVPEAVIPTAEEVADAYAMQRPIPTPKVKFVKKEISGPFVDWIPPDQFLYEPGRSDYYKTSRYSIHANWMTWDELFAEATTQDWDIEKIKRFKAETENEYSETGKKESHQEVIEAAKETPLRKGFKDNKVLVTENYISTYDPLGREKVNLAVMVGNKVLVRNKASIYMALKYPFVPIVANRLPGTIEGLSSVDRTKGLQRLFNEIFNSWIDAITYRIFPPFKKKSTNAFAKQPVYGPGEIWDLTDPEGLTPVIENVGDLPDLANLMIAVSAKIRQMLNAPDLSQGFTATPYEKAASVNLRATGAARKSSSTYKNYGEAIVKVSEMFLALNQQYHDEGYKFVMDCALDVPSLTSMTNPEQEKQEMIFLNQMLAAEPIYNQGKIGLEKRRAVIEEIVRMIKRRKAGDFYMTSEELDAVLQTQALATEAMLDKQAVAEEMQMQQPPTAGGQ